MESYRELRDRQQKEFNELPLGFAFSDKQFENFCKNLYQTAYEEGRRSVPGIDITEVQKAISETPGIGAKRLEAITESLNSKFAKEEDA